MVDAKLKRRHCHGQTHGMAKLTAADVAHIRVAELPTRQLGQMFGVHHKTIARIRSRHSWR
jgi:hypothetical protein